MSLFGSFWKKDSKSPRKVSSPGRWQIGYKIGGQYEICQILGGEGKSGMGIVYICHDHGLQGLRALKTFQEKFCLDEETKNLFQQETFLWVELGRYPFIVCADLGTVLEDRLFIILEYIPPDAQGRNTLTHYLSSLTLPDILKFSIQFCYGMEYAYSKGVDCHRDIKPDNIMITPDKTVKITDFGLAKVFQETKISENVISPTGKTGLSVFQTKDGKRACGTQQYMAPEQFDCYADKRSDIYAFGITLYETATGGRLPFIGKGRTELEVIKDYERLHKYENAPIVSSPLYPIIRRCIEKLPQNRYQKFEELRKDLESLLKQEYNETVKTPTEISEQDRLGEYDSSLWMFDGCLEEEAPKGEEAAHWRSAAESLFTLGRLSESLFCVEKALEFEPNNARSLEIKALILQDLGWLKEVLGIFSKLFESNPDNKLVCFHKALCEDYLGKKEAVNSYKQFVMLASDNDSNKLEYAKRRLRELEDRRS